jgi:hypothetical protein
MMMIIYDDDNRWIDDRDFDNYYFSIIEFFNINKIRLLQFYYFFPNNQIDIREK